MQQGTPAPATSRVRPTALNVVGFNWNSQQCLDGEGRAEEGEPSWSADAGTAIAREDPGGIITGSTSTSRCFRPGKRYPSCEAIKYSEQKMLERRARESSPSWPPG